MSPGASANVAARVVSERSRDIAPPLPHNLGAERSVLGAVLLDNHALNTAIREKLKPEHFFLDQHRRVFQQMIALRTARQPIDLVTLHEALSAAGELEAAGGAGYLAQLLDGVPRVTNVEHYARIVKDYTLATDTSDPCNPRAAMPRIYLDQMGVIALGRNPQAEELEIRGRIEQGRATLVLSPAHWLDTAGGGSEQRSRELARFMDGFRPV